MILDGKKIAKEILEKVKSEVGSLGFAPLFCDVLVGEDPVSLSYVSIKGKIAEETGIAFRLKQYPSDISEDNLVQGIKRLNDEPGMCGLIVQLPLPAFLDRQIILDAIRPEVDVDCLGRYNTERFYRGDLEFIPPTAAAVLEILKSTGQDFSGKRFAVVGQGMLVGKPVSFLLRRIGYEVFVADAHTPDIASVTKKADVVISGTGQPGSITAGMVKPGAVVIDAGTAEMDGGIVGDVDFQSVSKAASLISPVPGGVGPVTVAMLLYNVVKSARLAKFQK